MRTFHTILSLSILLIVTMFVIIRGQDYVAIPIFAVMVGGYLLVAYLFDKKK